MQGGGSGAGTRGAGEAKFVKFGIKHKSKASSSSKTANLRSQLRIKHLQSQQFQNYGQILKPTILNTSRHISITK